MTALMGAESDNRSGDCGDADIVIVATQLCVYMHNARVRDVGYVFAEITRSAVTASNVDEIISSKGRKIRGYGERVSATSLRV